MKQQMKCQTDCFLSNICYLLEPGRSPQTLATTFVEKKVVSQEAYENGKEEGTQNIMYTSGAIQEPTTTLIFLLTFLSDIKMKYVNIFLTDNKV